LLAGRLVLLIVVAAFCFGYPFVMAWYWIAGGLIFYFYREFNAPPQTEPPDLDHWPPISIIVPCYNESDNAEETLSAAAGVDYPDFQVIAVENADRLAMQRANLGTAHALCRAALPHLLTQGGSVVTVGRRSDLDIAIEGSGFFEVSIHLLVQHSSALATRFCTSTCAKLMSIPMRNVTVSE
jgi:cellulose synthase/poly-beta-1,6-N-acetylglucosamine synthase-like glycosyltransferase